MCCVRTPACAFTDTLEPFMSPTWIWLQIAIVIFVLIGVVIAITRLA
jgi:hypothetical protein